MAFLGVHAILKEFGMSGVSDVLNAMDPEKEGYEKNGVVCGVLLYIHELKWSVFDHG